MKAKIPAKQVIFVIGCLGVTSFMQVTMGIKNDVKSIQDCKENMLALRDSLELLGGKWKLLIVLYLSKRTQELLHFKKLEKAITGISAKMLAKELRSLEENEMVTRTIQDTKPITVTYALTDYGKSLVPIAKGLQEWGLDHRKKVKGK